MFCPRCGHEFREGFDRCPDCDVDLVAEPSLEPLSGDGPPADGASLSDDEPLAELGVTCDRALLAVLRSLLDDAEIPYVLQGEGWLNLLPAHGAGTPARILVRESDLVAASDLVSSVADVTDDDENDGSRTQDGEPISEDRLEPGVATSWFELLTVGSVAWLWSVFYDVSDRVWPPAEPAATAPLPHEPESIYWIELGSIVASIPLILLILYVVSMNDPNWKRHTGLVRLRASDCFVALAVLFVDLSAYAFAHSTFGTDLSHSYDYPAVTHTAEYLVSFLGLGVATFQEELLYRGYLILRLRTLLGSQWLGVVGSALLFGGFHLYQGVPGAVLATVSGLLYGCVFTIAPRLWPLVAAHLLWNLSALW